MAAALSAVIAAGLKGDTPGPCDAAAGPSEASTAADALTSAVGPLGEQRTASGTLSTAIFNALTPAPADHPHAGPPDVRARIDVDAPAALSMALPSAAAVRASETLAGSAAPQERTGRPGTKAQGRV